MAFTSTQWTKKVIRIRFLSGTSELQRKVKRAAKEWHQYANIDFLFVKKEPSDIRISINDGSQGGSWSKLGTEALKVASTSATMSLDIIGKSDLYIKATTLHEFGHVLGLVHEHSSPASSIKWNKQQVYDDHKGIWPPDKVDSQIFEKYSGTVTNFTAFDPHSIMLYPFPKEWTTDGTCSKYNTELSDTDKSYIAILYPPDSSSESDDDTDDASAYHSASEHEELVVPASSGFVYVSEPVSEEFTPRQMDGRCYWSYTRLVWYRYDASLIEWCYIG